MRRKLISWWPVICIALVLVGITAYNLWAYMCGYCALQDMKRIGPQARAVGYLVLGAVLCWLLLFFSRIFKSSSHHCRCGRNITVPWSFCPDCGQSVK